MRRILTASALLALAALTTAAIAQPPKSDTKPAGPPKTDKANTKPADPTDAAIAAALANDADVKMAKAKIQLAEAELAKARQAVTLKVVMLRAKVEQLKVALRSAEANLAAAADRSRVGAAPPSELNEARDRVEAAKSALALAESEWKLLTERAGGSASAGAEHDAVAFWDHDGARLWRVVATADLVRERTVAVGPVPDRIRTALDKPVKLGAKGEKVTFAKALEVFKKETGLDVPVRPMPSPMPEVVSEGEELPVGAWFQLYQDTAANAFTLYVREYGLLVANKQTAPPDAPTLTEFWKQKPPAKDVKGTKTDPASK